MYHSIQTVVSPQIHQYKIYSSDDPLTFHQTIIRWRQDAAFRDFFIRLLRDSPFKAYRWETPPLNNELIDRPFEFVLLDTPWLNVPADSETFGEFFTIDTVQFKENGHKSTVDNGIVTFANLGQDAMLIAPTPQANKSIYPHLACFLRHGPEVQIHGLWQVTAKVILEQLTDHLLWLNTAGGGVAWLHIRLDSKPKYYGFEPYKTI